jgi:hypothetical protein
MQETEISFESIRHPEEFWEWMMTVCPLETLAVFNIPFELTNRGLVVMHLRYTCSTPGVGSDCLHIQAVQRGNAEPIRKELCAPLKLSRGLNCTLTHRCICADIAQFNRVVGGMFILQHRRQRTNAANQYSKFYPVQYTDEPDEQPFGPLYRECVNGQTAGCTEPTFNKNQALLENSGIVGITNICDTFENVPLREEFCDTICLIDAPARLAGELVGHDTRSWDTGNQQCVTCRGMCLDHFQAEDKTTEAQASSPAGQEALTRLCSSCIDYYEAEEEDDDLGKYSSLGSLHFYADPLPAGDSANCAAYKERCSELLCNGCITMDAQPVLNSPIIFDEESNVCFKKLPICDEYLYSQRELTCTATVLAEIGGCVPTTIGDGTCDESCNTAYCGYDRGDCCTDNLAGMSIASRMVVTVSSAQSNACDQSQRRSATSVGMTAALKRARRSVRGTPRAPENVLCAPWSVAAFLMRSCRVQLRQLTMRQPGPSIFNEGDTARGCLCLTTPPPIELHVQPQGRTVRLQNAHHR